MFNGVFILLIHLELNSRFLPDFLCYILRYTYSAIVVTLLNTFEYDRICHVWMAMPRAQVFNCWLFAVLIVGTDEPFICWCGHITVILQFYPSKLILVNSGAYLVVLRELGAAPAFSYWLVILAPGVRQISDKK